MTSPTKHQRLPTGLAGRCAALGLLFVLLWAAWLAVVDPLAAWYADRAERLDQRRALSLRMTSLAASLPALERQLADRAGAGPVAGALFAQPSDAVAAASLQQRLQEMASGVGASLSSTEVLAAEPVGAYHRIRVRVALSGSWPVLVSLFQVVAGSSPQMLVDDVQLRSTPVVVGRDTPPLDASFTVLGFRASDGVASR